MPTVKVTDADFVSRVLESTGPVLVDFWATWCGPCRAVAPILEELADEYEGKVTIAKVDVDEAQATAQQFRIQSIPTLVLFDGGQPIKAVQGALPKEALIELLESNLPSLKPPHIAAENLEALMRRGVPIKIFDLRDPRDVKRSHLRHAKPLDETSLDATLTELDHRSLVVLVCRSGDHSSEVAKRYAGRKPEVLALEKGLLEWEGSGRPTYNDDEEADLSDEIRV